MASKGAQRAKQTDDRRRAISAKYRQRHTARADEERAMRRQQSKLHQRWGHKRGGTPETLEKASQVQQGALARMFMAGHISTDELAWACEIRVVAERIGADVAIGTVSLETRVDQSRSGQAPFFERLGAVRAEVAYTHWRASLAKPQAVLAMIVDDMPVSLAGRRFHMRTATARRILSTALQSWPDFQRDACDSLDEADLLAMHAGLV